MSNDAYEPNFLTNNSSNDSTNFSPIDLRDILRARELQKQNKTEIDDNLNYCPPITEPIQINIKSKLNYHHKQRTNTSKINEYKQISKQYYKSSSSPHKRDYIYDNDSNNKQDINQDDDIDANDYFSDNDDHKKIKSVVTKPNNSNCK
jgi:hypothetical protein